MSEEVATVDDMFNVVVLPGAAHLSEKDLDSEVILADMALKNQGYPRGTPVHWQPDSMQPSPFVAALVDVEGVPTMFIGLALEVIQAMHKAEKL